jgi:hypothetical protein
MGGTSKQTQQSTTEPWKPAQPALNGILGQLQGLIPNSGLSSTSNDAINQMEGNAQAGNPYSDQIGGVVGNLLNGGGANAQAPAIQNGLNTYQQQTNPLASNTDYNPYNTPGFSDALKTMGSDITNQVNGQFAAAGRDMSGMNSQTLGRGLAQGLSSTIANQYNQNVQNQQGAAQNQYNAGNTSAGLLSGINQASLGNQVQGISSANDAMAAKNYTPAQLLQLEQLKQQLPAQNLGLLTQIGVPIAGLGQQSQGSGSQTMSGAQQFGMIANGVGNIGKFLFGA